MAEPNLQKEYVDFILHLVTALRQIAIYPPKHPLVVNSFKGVFSSLSTIFASRREFNLTLNPDGKISVDQEVLQDKTSSAIQDFVPYFKRLEIEDLIFSAGITESEIEQFVKIFMTDPAVLKQFGDLNAVFKEKAVEHIKVKQFEYLKVEKGKEAFIAEGKPADYEKLKLRLKDFAENKIQDAQELQAVQNEIFSLVKDEFKQTNKLSLHVKNMLKKFIQHSPEKGSTLDNLKNALIEYGCPPEQVEALLSKIASEIDKPTPQRRRASIADIEALEKENEELRSKLNSLQQDTGRHVAAVEQLQKENRRINSEKQRIDNIVRNMAEGMVVVDAEGRIILVNPAAESLLGITKADIGKPIKEVVKDEHLLTLTKKIAADKDSVVEQDIELLSADESTKKVLRTSSAVVEDPNGNTVGMVTMLNDITKQKEVEALKGQFMASVSHELRTPLVAIEKSIALILSKATGEISDTQNQFLSIADRNLKRLTLLINDLLDLSKLEAHKMMLSRQPTSVDKLIIDSLESLNNWAQSKSVTLQHAISADLPLVELDPNRIIQVLNNLIGNAIKYTPEKGTVTVLAGRAEGVKAVQVTVQDTGVGIPQESLGKVFEKFYQVSNQHTSDVKGTGIGLAIVKEIVELHGGRVWAESEPGKGSRFIFTVPLEILSEVADGKQDQDSVS